MRNEPLIFYKSFFCPFCPEAERRIEALRTEYRLDVRKINVTWRPDILIKKGIKAVPAVEVGGRRLVGLPTTRQLKELLEISAADEKQGRV